VQCRYDLAHIPLLKQSYSREPRCAGLDAGIRIFHRDAAESEDGNLFTANLPQGLKTRRRAVRGFSFSEDRAEDREIGALCCGTSNFAWSVTGDANRQTCEGTRATLSPNLSDFCWG
jgi:hypothetical protein